MSALMAEDATFGDRLREFRGAAGLTLAELAERTGMHLQTLAKIESGERPNPTWDTIRLLAKALDKTPNDFLPPGAKTPPPKRGKK